MKLIHLADLHIGKRLKEVSLYDDQKYILDQILGIIDDEKPAAVMIAGDVYDRTMPAGEAVTMLDDFLYDIISRDIAVLMISGNHDSAERVAFGSRFMSRSGLHISPVYSGEITPVTITDGDISADIWLLPFIRPYSVKKVFTEEEINGYNDAAAAAVDKMDIDPDRINILVAHQNCIMQTIGTLDYVDPALFGKFDYTALGHIHKPQDPAKNVRYCGSPLHYSLPETPYDTSVTMVEIGSKDDISYRLVPLRPLHEMREVTGTFEELIDSGTSEDYIYVKLTDKEPVPYAGNRLRNVFPNMMELRYINAEGGADEGYVSLDEIGKKTDEEMFSEFFSKVNKYDIPAEYAEVIGEIFREIREEDV